MGKINHPANGGVIYVSDASISRILSLNFVITRFTREQNWRVIISLGWRLLNQLMPPYNRPGHGGTIVRLHRIGVFLPLWLPITTVGSYPTLFTFASSALKTFSVFVATIGSMVSVTLSRPHPITDEEAAVNRYRFCVARLPAQHNGVRTFLPAVLLS